jgi:hypothetical protein
MSTLRARLAVAGLCLLWGVGLAGAPAGQVFQGPEIEAFLAHADITSMKDIGVGVTLPRKATLEQDGVTRYAVFKTIDDKPNHPVETDAGVEIDFQDSWRTEVAAYELDKLIGLGMVPATVKRTYGGQTGSLQLWVDSIMDENTRIKKKIQPPDPDDWNNQVETVHLWDNLIYNVDRNGGNILITPDWRLVAIDHSRTFRPFGKLRDAKQLTRFSKSLLARLATLDKATLSTHLVAPGYLTPFQVDGILKRRDEILDLAKKLVAEKGEAAVLFK